MRKFLLALVLLVVVLVVLDRAGLLVAEREVGTRLQTADHLSARPGVSIKGFPFLTQVAVGQYQEIDVTISSFSTDGVRVRDIDAKFTKVHAPVSLLFGQDSSDVTARQATGSALIPYSQMEKRLPSGIKLAADGRYLKVSGSTSYGSASGTAKLAVTSKGVTFTPEQLSIDGVSAGSLGSKFSFTIPVSGLPLHLTITAVRVTPSGLVLAATGRNVAFASK